MKRGMPSWLTVFALAVTLPAAAAQGIALLYCQAQGTTSGGWAIGPMTPVEQWLFLNAVAASVVFVPLLVVVAVVCGGIGAAALRDRSGVVAVVVGVAALAPLLVGATALLR